MNSGIYKILNKVNGKFYIGSAKNFNKRWWVHRSLLRANKHHCEHLQAAWNKYWEQSFEFVILECCEIKDLTEREQHWLNKTRCFKRNFGYNACAVAGNTIGYKHTEEFKAWQAERVTGNKHSLETRAKMSASHKNRPKVSEETKARISKGKTGKYRIQLDYSKPPLTKKDDGSWH